VALQVRTQPPPQRATVKVRESVSQLSANAIERFREAMRAFLARPDNRGFQFFAGWHGVPLGICQHHNELFLPWHRGYLYFFELALQDIDPDVSLPWWDWMDEAGLPAPYDKEGDVLSGAPIEPQGVQPQPDWPKETFRDLDDGTGPGPHAVPPPIRQAMAGQQNAYDWMMAAGSYLEFSQRNWRLHDNIHVWVGGTMGDPNWAAYDPLFWAHHTMVDRLWRIWQHNTPGGDPPAELLDVTMTSAQSPSMKVKEVLQVQQLGYEYAGQESSVGGSL
jgi:tyrosinase